MRVTIVATGNMARAIATRARELEALGYLHMAIQPALGTHFESAVKVLR
jgi:hypothetical protein